MKMLSGLNSTVNSLTSVVISLLGLGIVVSLLGGNVPFVGLPTSDLSLQGRDHTSIEGRAYFDELADVPFVG